jgi:hypothetical protein
MEDLEQSTRIAKALWDACGLKESGPEKIDVIVAKCGDFLEVAELRDVTPDGSGFEADIGELPIARFKTLLAERAAPGRIGVLSLISGVDDDESQDLFEFLASQSHRLGFTFLHVTSPNRCSAGRTPIGSLAPFASGRI